MLMNVLEDTVREYTHDESLFTEYMLDYIFCKNFDKETGERFINNAWQDVKVSNTPMFNKDMIRVCYSQLRLIKDRSEKLMNKKNKGQSMVDYAIILAFVALLCYSAYANLGGAVKYTFKNVSNKLSVVNTSINSSTPPIVVPPQPPVPPVPPPPPPCRKYNHHGRCIKY